MGSFYCRLIETMGSFVSGSNLGCLEFILCAKQIERLSQAAPIRLGFPHDFLVSEGIRKVVSMGTYRLIKKRVMYRAIRRVSPAGTAPQNSGTGLG